MTDEHDAERAPPNDGGSERRKPPVALLVAPIVVLGIGATIATALTVVSVIAWLVWQRRQGGLELDVADELEAEIERDERD